MFQVSTVPGLSQSVCDALEFDLTRDYSDRDVATQLDKQVPESDATPSLDGMDRRSVGNSGQRFVRSTPHVGDVAHVQTLEAQNARVGSPRSTEDMMESEVPHSDDHSVTSDEESVAGEPLERLPDEEVPTVLPHLRDAVIRAAIRSMDEVNHTALFDKRAAV